MVKNICIIALRKNKYYSSKPGFHEADKNTFIYTKLSPLSL